MVNLTMKDTLLEYAYRRIVELEKLLLVDVPETVWPAEVAMVLSQVENAGDLPAFLFGLQSLLIRSRS